MSKHLFFLFLWLLASVVTTPGARAQEPGTKGPPPNMRAGVFREVVARMWRDSATFRRQCQRLGAAPELTITFRAEPPQNRSFRAFSTITRKHGAIIRAEIVVLSSAETIELIAHEAEHLIEQLDGVDPRHHQVTGAVRSTQHAYESERAIEVGRRVAREVVPGRVVMNLRQRDAWSGALDPASSSISADGRFIAFTSYARLTPDDGNDLPDLYVRDLRSQQTKLESPALVVGNRYSRVLYPRISGDGSRIAFQAAADDPDATDRLRSEVLVLDRGTGVSLVIGADVSGRRDSASGPSISADGNTVVFESTPLRDADGSRPAAVNIYLVRLDTGRTVPVSVSLNGEVPVAGDSVTPAVSADGRFVVFTSTADLTCADATSCASASKTRRKRSDIYLRDTIANTTSLISGRSSGAEANGSSSWAAISGDGRFVVFTSEASNLVRGDRNKCADVFLHDTNTGVTELISRRPDGEPGSAPSRNPVISDDGSTVAFQSLASDLICTRRCEGALRDINLVWDVFVLDRRSGAMLRASAGGGEEWMEPSRRPSVDGSGHVVVFSSHHPIDTDDAGNDDDLYVSGRSAILAR